MSDKDKVEEWTEDDIDGELDDKWAEEINNKRVKLKKDIFKINSVTLKGGPGSGHHGHGGLPGVHGGSKPSGKAIIKPGKGKIKPKPKPKTEAKPEDTQGLSRQAAIAKLEEAKEQEPAVTQMVTKLADQHGGEMWGLEYKFKTAESMSRKIESRVNQKGLPVEEAADEITDALRYTVVFEDEDYVPALRAMKSQLEEQGWVKYDEKWKNYFASQGSYQGYNAIYVNKETGYRFELQYHTPQSKEASFNGHTLYEKWRVSEDGQQKSTLYKQMVDLWVNVSKPPGWDTLPGQFVTTK
jgi:hypothetical protein